MLEKNVNDYDEVRIQTVYYLSWFRASIFMPTTNRCFGSRLEFRYFQSYTFQRPIREGRFELKFHFSGV